MEIGVDVRVPMGYPDIRDRIDVSFLIGSIHSSGGCV